MLDVWVHMTAPDYIAFRDPAHILPSLRITYSACPGVRIVNLVDNDQLKTFVIERPGVTDTILQFKLYQVHDAPSHL